MACTSLAALKDAMIRSLISSEASAAPAVAAGPPPQPADEAADPPSDEDILMLSVGGRLCCTTRAVLTQEEGALASMFSGRWEGKFVTHSNRSCMFLDFDADCFELILYHLRLQLLTGKPIDWGRVEGPSGKEEYFAALLSYFCLVRTSEDGPQVREASHRFGMCSPDVTGAGETIATNVSDHPSEGHGWAIGDVVMQGGEFAWGFRILQLPTFGTVVLGILGIPSPLESPPDGASFLHETCSGWHSGGLVWKNGQGTHGTGGWTGFQTGDEVRMYFKADEGVLQMRVARHGNQTFEITGLNRLPWRAHAYLHHSGSSIELISRKV